MQSMSGPAHGQLFYNEARMSGADFALGAEVL
jgi:hypothetical protein